MFSERLAQAEAEHFESLRATSGAALDRDGLQLMLSAAQREDVALLDTCTAPLYTFAEGQATVAAAYKALRRLNAQRSLKDSTRARTTLDRLVLRPLLQRRAAREQDLYDDPDIQRLAKRAYQDALLNAVRNRFAAVEMLSDAEVWSYYDSHPDMFYHEESVEVEELLASSPAEAQWLSDQLAAGASFVDLADRSVRAQAVQSQARFHFHPRDEKLYPAPSPGHLCRGTRPTRRANPGARRVLHFPRPRTQPRPGRAVRAGPAPRPRSVAPRTGKRGLHQLCQRPAPALSEPGRDRRASTQSRPAGFAGPGT